MHFLPLSFLLLVLTACKPDDKTVVNSPVPTFGAPVRVVVNGYSGNLMEPFLSRDGKILLFNNLNAAPENTNLHWATRINDSVFEYKGEIAGVNTPDLEGVPTMDNGNNLYFVSTRSYANSLSTLYQSNFNAGTATNVKLVDGVSRLTGGWVNFDVEVSADGQTLYFVDRQFGSSPNSTSADLVIAKKAGTGFQRLDNSADLMQNINTTGLEYAACISVNQLEFYFTRIRLPITANTIPEIFVATRKSINDPFGVPVKITSITGFAEAATISPDQQRIYYHKKENGIFVLYMVKKM